MEIKELESYAIDICIAGDLSLIEKCCQSFCNDIGLCVTVTPTNYIYTGGKERGAIVGIKMYPRFPKDKDQLWDEATRLALCILDGANQQSCMINGPDKVIWLSNRDE